jgi:hypothetical protein
MKNCGPTHNGTTSAECYDENSWRVEDIPNWGNHWLAEVAYTDLSHTDFLRRYADHWEPIVIRGACCGWPAFSRWADDDYLLKRWGATKVNIFTAPNPQGNHPDTISTRRNAQVPGVLADLIRSDGKNESVRAFTLGDGAPLDGMIEDIDDHWLDGSTLQSLLYPRRRVFIHRGGLSLWHKHPVDDHLTFQVRGSKQFVLLPPSQSDRICDVNNDELYSFAVDVARYPKWKTIQPICARLDAGDAIYIPPGWWHTVVPMDQTLGITLASVWGSSRKAILTRGLRSLFYKGNREHLKYFPLVLLYGLTGWRRVLSPARP